ncbi:MAG: glycosyltransferase, partial [bacterium]|nr:glycosyltransferase [bacterium]
MTILQINKHYYPRDGTSVAMLNLSKLLEKHGHSIVPFSMTQPENLPTPYDHSFVSQVWAEKVRFDWQGLRTAFRALYSFEAKRKIAKLIRLAKPDLAHVHNIYNQISPSIFAPLRRAKIPVVMSVHDWALISPNYNLFDHHEICERGLGHQWKIVKHRCVKDSLVASFWAALVFSFHHWFRFYERGVKKYIVPSQFVKDKLIAAGLPVEKIVLI